MSAKYHREMSDQQHEAPVLKSGSRRYTSKACEECRRRRTKCDGNRPACSRCTSRGIACCFRLEEDGRRPAPKSYVQLLRNRIKVLEQILRSNDIDVDAAVAQAAAGDGSSAAQAGVLHVPTSSDPDAGTGSSSHESEELCAAFEGALSLDESLNFDQDGEIRYFGPTSGRLEFQECATSASGFSRAVQSDATAQSIQSRTLRHQGCLLQTKFEAHMPDALKAELIDMYFTWEQPWFQVVNEELFREGERFHGRYTSPLLLNCVLCIGSRFSDKVELRTDPNDPNTAGELFLKRAEQLLQYELKWPSITTMQALCLFGVIYHAFGADAPGWLHSGMANRLALDMGLNLDSDQLAGSHLIPPEEIDLRRQIYWAMYIYDKLSATYTGRVCTMLDSQGSVKIPSSSKPHQSALISLSRIYEKIQLNLYAPKPSLTGPQKFPFILSCILELKNWFYDLPSELRIDRLSWQNTPPQVYTMHMVYHTSFILLMKPFLGRSQPPEAAAAAANNSITKKACAICYEASRKIILVARKYRQVYGSFRRSPISATHCTLSAALVLFRMAKLNGGEIVIRDKRMIEDCLQVLEELSTAWNIAKRIRESLVKLYRQLQAESKDSSAGVESAHTDDGRSDLDAHGNAPVNAQIPAERYEGLSHALTSDDPTSDLQEFVCFGSSPEEMLLDDSLWANPNMNLTLDLLTEDYYNFDLWGSS
ncbi:putative Zn(II)2Cys6 transcription factor [Macrophomina phaseolina]|uniref:Zn(II)2Cys6 transcription factor n=1 Tax=Macrophomina phaseolina TaxID=35725 RepID=A0ABQ8FPJ5_9PEZI|nr:putative Zn(II)2Cys6 transcription factor [Macrophomina phaseolina]